MGESAWSAVKKSQPPPANQQSSQGGRAQDKKTAGNKPGFGGLSLDAHYAECYPGMAEEYDATYDSDDEADYTKMDMVSFTHVYT